MSEGSSLAAPHALVFLAYNPWHSQGKEQGVVGQPPDPEDIRYDNARQRLEITWDNGEESAYHYEFLRWHCPCAACAGEMGAPGELQFTEVLRPDQFQLQEIELIGAYGVRPTWADGHNGGIFTFSRLYAWKDEAAQDLEHKLVRGPRSGMA